MPRLLPAVPLVFTLALIATAGESGPLERALAVQAALAEAREALTAGRPAEAIAALEHNLHLANGNRAYLELLRSAYAAEVKRLQLRNGDPARLADLRTKLALLGAGGPDEGGRGAEGEPKPVAAAVPAGAPTPAGSVTPTDPPSLTRPAPPFGNGGQTVLQEAAELFDQGKDEPRKYGLAARLFAAAFADRVRLTPDQQTAWAYCRVRVAAEQLRRADLAHAEAQTIASEVEDALKLVPDNAELQAAGRELLTVARLRAAWNGAAAQPTAGPTSASVDQPSDGWSVVESPSFRVRHQGNRELAEAVVHAGEKLRGEIFTRWSGPPGGPWAPKCEVHLHADADAFARATKQPVGSTGQALVNLERGQVTARRIDLRADDRTTLEDALPRELTHVVLADLFPTQAPPRWAVEGMAVLAASQAELERYLRTAARCRRTGELLSAPVLMEATAPPAERVTGFHAGSVALVEFLVRWKGEKAFTTFLRDGQRYGLASALKRQYGVADARQLDEVWSRGTVSQARGQAH